jgi:dUTP pyrophosphatase
MLQTLKLKKLHDNVVLPKVMTAGAACFDLCALVESERALLRAGESLEIRTGLSVQVPEGMAMLIFSRSGHGFGGDIRLSNCVGVIDSDYRGELKVKLRADGDTDLHVRHGDRIAQALLVPTFQYQFEVVNELDATARGEGGFGSTGQ